MKTAYANQVLMMRHYAARPQHFIMVIPWAKCAWWQSLKCKAFE
jgi:hypothetical protein